jgi:orotate phosphoribosyltransferase
VITNDAECQADGVNLEGDRAALARRVGNACRLSGAFTLRSGQTATTYFDKYLFEGDPALLDAVANAAVSLIPRETQVLAGLELGGVPVATAMSLVSGLPAAFVRKEAKSYGTEKLAEGAEIRGRKVLVVEDVVTTGGQVMKSASELKVLGAEVISALCIVDRSRGENVLDSAGVPLLALFTADEL